MIRSETLKYFICSENEGLNSKSEIKPTTKKWSPIQKANLVNLGIGIKERRNPSKL